jgi:hypothetical protein
MSLCRQWLHPSLPSSIVKWAREDRQERTRYTFFMAGLVDGGEEVGAREIREWWPLLTIETELNGDSKRTKERVPFYFGSLGLSCRFCLGFSSPTSTKYFFPHPTLFQCLCPHASHSKLGSQPCCVACVLVCVSGWSQLHPEAVRHEREISNAGR